jgi:hypothetical protein
MIDFRPNQIENYLVTLHTGQWFGWSDSSNKVYANLVIHDLTKTKPTEQECVNGLAQMQAEYEAKEYQRQRATAYPSIADQLDTLYHGGYDAWKATITAVKEEFPKP